MKHCQNCGVELNDDAYFCTSCGYAVQVSDDNSNAENSTKNEHNTSTPSTYNDSTPKQSKSSGDTNDAMGIVSIIVSAIGIPFSLLFAISGYLFGGAGLALAILSCQKNPLSSKGKIGLVLSVITLSCSFVNSIFGFLFGLILVLL